MIAHTNHNILDLPFSIDCSNESIFLSVSTNNLVLDIIVIFSDCTMKRRTDFDPWQSYTGFKFTSDHKIREINEP